MGTVPDLNAGALAPVADEVIIGWQDHRQIGEIPVIGAVEGKGRGIGFSRLDRRYAVASGRDEGADRAWLYPGHFAGYRGRAAGFGDLFKPGAGGIANIEGVEAAIVKGREYRRYGQAATCAQIRDSNFQRRGLNRPRRRAKGNGGK